MSAPAATPHARLRPDERERFLGDWPTIEKVLVSFLKNEVEKAGFARVVLGLSGGIDSALAAAIAVRAFGPGGVLGVIMPHARSNPASAADAALVAREFGFDTATVDITRQIEAYFETEPDASHVRRGNKMSRERMSILYDLSAARTALVLGTSNKTELLLGYGTLYGDMACAVNPVGDLYKTQVRALSRQMKIPERVIEKPPSADLWEGQSDEGDLGFTYDEVDQLLFLIVDCRLTRKEAVERGFSDAFVAKVETLVRRSQFKRRLPTIAKISGRTVTNDFLYARDWGS
ncbi:MAG: NAD+ synthase [bacterium]